MDAVISCPTKNWMMSSVLELADRLDAPGRPGSYEATGSADCRSRSPEDEAVRGSRHRRAPSNGSSCCSSQVSSPGQMPTSIVRTRVYLQFQSLLLTNDLGPKDRIAL